MKPHPAGIDTRLRRRLGLALIGTFVVCAPRAETAGDAREVAEVRLADGRTVTMVHVVAGQRTTQNPLTPWRDVVEREHAWTVTVREVDGASRILLRYEEWGPDKTTRGAYLATGLAASPQADEVVIVGASTEIPPNTRRIRLKGHRIPIGGPPLVADAAALVLNKTRWDASFNAAAAPGRRPEMTGIIVAPAGDLLAITVVGKDGPIGELALDPARRSACLVLGDDLHVTWDPFGFGTQPDAPTAAPGQPSAPQDPPARRPGP